MLDSPPREDNLFEGETTRVHVCDVSTEASLSALGMTAGCLGQPVL